MTVIHMTAFEFEYSVRNYVREQILRLEALTEGHSSNNSVSYHQSGEFTQWSVTIGRTYNDCVTIKGEVLSGVVSAACAAYAAKDAAKLTALAPPEEPVTE
jgi:hypothetical protein